MVFRISTLKSVIALGTSLFLASAARADDSTVQSLEQAQETAQQAETKIADSLAQLPVEDQKLARSQRFCPVRPHVRLGAMGAPIKLMIDGKPAFLCCQNCSKAALADGSKTLKTIDKLRESTEVLAKLSQEERSAIEAQKHCAVIDGSILGSMGVPVKLVLNGKPVYVCCSGCTKKAQADPAATLSKVEKLKKSGQ